MNQQHAHGNLLSQIRRSGSGCQVVRLSPRLSIQPRTSSGGRAMARCSFNPMDPEFLADPYPTYHRLRAEDPVHHSPLGFWVLTRYEDVVAVLRDPRFAKEALAAFVAARFGMTVPPGLGLSMLDRDPPDHTRLRSLVSKAFTPRVVEVLRPHIQQIVDGLLATRAGRQRDGPDRGVRLSAAGHRHLRDARRARWRTTSASRAGASTSRAASTRSCCRRTPRWPSAASPSRRALADYFRELIAERRAAPRDDLLSGAHRRRGGGRQAERGGAARDLHPAPRRRPRDHGQPDRQRHPGAAAPPRPSCDGCARTPG